MNRCRLVIDDRNTAAWNMAVDEALLRSAAENGLSTLRLYAWSEGTLSLGYFQKHQDRDQHTASLSCPLVRRHSGGGAILHDQEITYSLTLPIAERWNSEAGAMVNIVHTAVAKTLRDYGLDCRLCDAPADNDRFLCFQRHAVGDLLCDGHKILGSAQRRRKSALLQHGSLLLKRSTAAPELPGILDLGGSGPTESLWRTLPDSILDALQMNSATAEISDVEATWAKEIEATKFGTQGWTLRR